MAEDEDDVYPPHQPPLRVVVIDDNDDTRSLMWAFLTMELPESIRIHTLTDVEWQEGVSWEEVAVAIVDVMMPVTDGRVVLQWLRDTYPDCCRIAWTAAREEYVDEIMEKGLAHSVVSKPGLEELRALIKAVI